MLNHGFPWQARLERGSNVPARRHRQNPGSNIPCPTHTRSRRGLGYSALWFAYGAGPGTVVESVERDPQHAAIAIDHFKAEGLGERIKVFAGHGAEVLPTLKDTYDLGYFDTDPAESLIDLEQFERLLKPAGLLISANLFLGNMRRIYPVWKKPRNIGSAFSTARAG